MPSTKDLAGLAVVSAAAVLGAGQVQNLPQYIEQGPVVPRFEGRGLCR